MDTKALMDKHFPQDKAQQFADILKNSISSYIAQKDSRTVEEWLNSYLAECMPDKNAEEISSVTNEIIRTITLHDETIASMRNAINSGKSVEAWFQEEISSNQSVGQQAYGLAEAHSALTSAYNQYAESDEQQEIIDVEVIPPEEWDDNNWNKYKMKELVTETVRQAGDTALMATASDLYSKITEYGFQTVLTDKNLLSEAVISSAGAGLKAATAGAMEIADIRNVFQDYESDTESRTLAASIAIENMKILCKVTTGEIGVVDGVAEIKNTSISAMAAIIKAKAAAVGSKVGKKIGATVGAVFGPVGAAVGHFAGGVIGKMAGTTVGSKVIETAKKVSSAAKSVVSKAVSAVKSFGSKVKSGIKSLFGR
ncbi:MAG: hypothetical protein NC340_06105 [Ruminococcus flavefaciens]|nr:hypothetical protein [Ruminococcus flavefaciens]MCM1231243.1 hypothetical protein [Ruminococcus flavefaciens]